MCCRQAAGSQPSQRTLFRLNHLPTWLKTTSCMPPSINKAALPSTTRSKCQNYALSPAHPVHHRFRRQRSPTHDPLSGPDKSILRLKSATAEGSHPPNVTRTHAAHRPVAPVMNQQPFTNGQGCVRNTFLKGNSCHMADRRCRRLPLSESNLFLKQPHASHLLGSVWGISPGHDEPISLAHRPGSRTPNCHFE